MARVYLVDDHPIVREATAALLDARGHAVVGQTDDPARAPDELQALAPDVLVADIQLGKHSGLDLLAELRRRDIRVRTIMLTSSEQPRDVARAMRLGAEGYLTKQSGGDELLRAIAAVTNGQRHYEGEVASLAAQAITAPDEASVLAGLSARERQVIEMVVQGMSSAQIGADLQLSPKTVVSYRSRLMAKVGARDVPALVRFALRVGLIRADQP